MKLRKTQLKTPLLAISAVLASFMLGGCASLDQVGSQLDDVGSRIDAGMQRLTTRSPAEAVDRITLPPAKHRNYREGDVFIYDSGRVNKVMQSKDGVVVWGDTDGEIYRTSKHFFAPRTRQAYRNRIVTREIQGNVDNLWPLEVGKRVSFSERRSTYWRAEGRADIEGRDWNCEVEDARVSVVPAGSYDTYRVTCRSYRKGRFSPRNFGPLQTLRWDYAPKLGHYVYRERTNSKGERTSVRRLSASLPASLATPKRVEAVIERLEAKEN